MSKLTHVSNSLPFPTQRLNDSGSLPTPYPPTPVLMRHMVEKQSAASGPLLKGGGGRERAPNKHPLYSPTKTHITGTCIQLSI